MHNFIVNMIVNPDKFQLILLQKYAKKVIQEKLQIDNNEIESENLATLLGIAIDDRVPLDTIFQNYVTKHPCN